MKSQPCKLMREDDTTGGDYHILQWGNGINNHIYNQGYDLCSDGVIHFYIHPLQAAFFYPIHVASYTKLREVTRHSEMISDNTKCAAKSVTTGKEIPLPKITPEQRIEIAIRCTLKVYHDPEFVKWANKWLSGEDRSSEVTYVSYTAAYYAAHAACAVCYAACAADAAVAVSCTGLPADQILQIIADVVGWGEE